MKKLRYICLILISCVLLGGLPVRAAAENAGFDLVSFPPEDDLSIKEQLEKPLSLADTPGAGYIYAFAVHENGWIACYVAKKQIDVYNDNGEFQYGYKVERGPYRVAWYGDDILVNNGGNYVRIVDSQGNVKDVMKIKEGHLDPYWRVINSLKKEVNGVTYRMQHSVKPLEWINALVCIDHIVRVEQDGTETILIDMRDRMPLIVRYAWLLFPLYMVLVVFFCVKQQIARERQRPQKTDSEV